MRIRFDTGTCSRCGGSGHYSYNQIDGTVCYGCGGSGKKLTKAGANARRIYEEALSIPAENVLPGMVMMVRVLGGSPKRLRVSEVVQGNQMTVNGEPVDNIGIRYGDKLLEHVGKQHKMTRALCPDIHDSIEAILEGVKGVTVEV